MRIEACSFSQNIGTPENTVGAISLKSSWIVRRLSAKLTVIPSERQEDGKDLLRHMAQREIRTTESERGCRSPRSPGRLGQDIPVRDHGAFRGTRLVPDDISGTPPGRGRSPKPSSFEQGGVPLFIFGAQGLDVFERKDPRFRTGAAPSCPLPQLLRTAEDRRSLRGSCRPAPRSWATTKEDSECPTTYLTSGAGLVDRRRHHRGGRHHGQLRVQPLPAVLEEDRDLVPPGKTNRGQPQAEAADVPRKPSQVTRCQIPNSFFPQSHRGRLFLLQLQSLEGCPPSREPALAPLVMLDVAVRLPGTRPRSCPGRIPSRPRCWRVFPSRRRARPCRSP